jgi:L-ascorbate metabolism protein UlaG (beta-lactamase superfamily)
MRHHALPLVVLCAAAIGSGLTVSPSARVEAPPPGGALVWYLGHCGYAVRTANHLLIFDYQEKRDGQQVKSRPGHPSLASGWIDPQEIKGLKVRAFASHAHEDHYDPVISTWRAAVPDIAYYFGWRAADNPADHYLVGPRAEDRSGDVEIATINSHHSGVPEVAWLVKVDGLVLYHNGDCQPNDPRAEYAYLRTKTESIDLAFVPPVYEDRQKYTLQNAELFSRFRVRAAFPMHVQADGAMYHDFQRATRVRFPDVPVRVPTVMGQRFVYANGRIQDR